MTWQPRESLKNFLSKQLAFTSWTSLSSHLQIAFADERSDLQIENDENLLINTGW